jgi:hypothetical protein
MHLKATGWKDVDWIHQTKDRDLWRDSVNPKWIFVFHKCREISWTAKTLRVSHERFCQWSYRGYLAYPTPWGWWWWWWLKWWHGRWWVGLRLSFVRQNLLGMHTVWCWHQQVQQHQRYGWPSGSRPSNGCWGPRVPLWFAYPSSAVRVFATHHLCFSTTSYDFLSHCQTT